MSVVDMNLEMSLSHVVEAMLPRFSDETLGLLISLDMGASDYGYGEDGNTREREPLHIRRFPNLLFIRPSNYTKVYFFEPEDGRWFGVHDNREMVWELQSDHDSCWRSDGFRNITDIYFNICKLICDRTGCAPKDVSTLIHMCSDPKYVQLECERVHPGADRYSAEGRLMRIKMSPIGFDRLVQHAHEENNIHGNMQELKTGLLVKGGETEERFLTTH